MSDSIFSATFNSSSPYREAIAEVLQLLEDAQIITPNNQQQVIAIAQDSLEDNSDFISIVWCADDVLPELNYLTRNFVRDECGIFGATLDDRECDLIIIETLRLYFRGEFQHTDVYWIANALAADKKIIPRV